jgi:tripartite-type tricarboxylate transporter receptor subunit TctC
MRVKSCTLLLIIFSLLAFCGFSIAGAQEKYPSRPINMLVEYAAGGATDGVARAIAEAAKKIFGVPISPQFGPSPPANIFLCSKFMFIG